MIIDCKAYARTQKRTLVRMRAPALYVYETLAYWTIEKFAGSRDFLAAIEHMTQVVINVRGEENKLAPQIGKARGKVRSRNILK